MQKSEKDRGGATSGGSKSEWAGWLKTHYIMASMRTACLIITSP
ncbi:hypothetical protein [Bradyrhizobium liaoningense]|nr:hypothetical protein [Bradyrhizobium liaoningense]